MIATAFSAMRRTFIGLSMLSVAAIPSMSVAGVVYNVNDAFKTNETKSGGPTIVNGSYSYGYIGNPAVPSTFDTASYVHTDATHVFANTPSLQGYFVQNNASVPAVVGNVTDQTITTSYGVNVQAGQLLLHSGGLTNNAFADPIYDADLRFTAPTAGLYSISGIFSQLHTGSTDVHVYINGNDSYFNTILSSGNTSAGFNFTTLLSFNSTVDFVVGPASDGIGADSTGLFANVVPVPEPASLISASMAVVVGLGYGLRRRKGAKTA